METNNVLFVRGSENVTSADNDIWDDTALIEAYDKAISLAKEEVSKRMGMEGGNYQSKQKLQNSKQSRHVSKPYKKWTVGAPCRAKYTEDGEIYEAIILNISESNGTCTVKFVGYGNTQKVDLSSLLESNGLQSQIAQQKDALAEDTNEETTGTDENINVSSQKYSGDRMDCETEETKMYQHQQFMPGPSFNAMTDMMPPAPPLPPQLMAKLPDNDAEALSSMLMSWYISGFHTGYYHGLKQAKCNRDKRTNC